MLALDTLTGDVLWKGAGSAKLGYATPVVAQINQRNQYVVFHGKGVVGVDAETGARIWSRKWKTNYDVNAATPVVLDGDTVFITSGYKTGCALVKVTGDQGKIAMKDHFLAYYPPWFVAELEQLLVEAEQAATSPKTRHWLKYSRDYLDYMKTVSNMFAAERTYQSDRCRANLLAVKESVDAFEDFRSRVIAYSSDMKYNDRNRPQYTMFNQYLMSDLGKLHTENVRGTPAALNWIVEPLNWDFEKLLAEHP